ncbi:ATP-binding protein [Streptomyces sp. NPDC087844]|uniref:ATP-binding protein n=1 Tax=Streptomyces sp. NPDC087844 TaxID=3365805 RepID=UPI0037FEEDD1
MTPTVPHRTPVTVRMFTQRFSSTPLGARLARQLALYRLHRWDIPYGSVASDNAALLVAELAANAVTHGRVTGRDFELALTLCGEPAFPGPAPRKDRGPTRLLRIDVTDMRGDRCPPRPGALTAPAASAVGGRGLLLVEALADRWEVLDRAPTGKTVRAELTLPHREEP